MVKELTPAALPPACTPETPLRSCLVPVRLFLRFEALESTAFAISSGAWFAAGAGAGGSGISGLDMHIINSHWLTHPQACSLAFE